MTDDPDDRAPGECLTRCPFCDSEGTLVPSECVQPLRVPYGPSCSFMANVERCSSCGESADFSGLNDARVGKALEEATRASVANMLEHLAYEGIMPAYVERSLDLPQGTLASWKHSRAALTILRIVRTYPWITQVAEAGFDSHAAAERLLYAAVAEKERFR